MMGKTWACRTSFFSAARTLAGVGCGSAALLSTLPPSAAAAATPAFTPSIRVLLPDAARPVRSVSTPTVYVVPPEEVGAEPPLQLLPLQAATARTTARTDNLDVVRSTVVPFVGVQVS